MKKIIVVGAGILGASTAYQLAKMGAEVLVIDRKDKGRPPMRRKALFVRGCHRGKIRRGTEWQRQEHTFTPVS